jgi:anaerobic selenocysteine-containing dehydrogenase
MTIREEKSFCRLCMAHCGMVLRIEDGRLLDVRGDHEDEQTLGYACFKGLQAPQTHYAPGRILRPLKRQPDGSFQEIGLEQALAEIAEKTAAILERDGAEAIAGYRGCRRGCARWARRSFSPPPPSINPRNWFRSGASACGRQAGCSSSRPTC